MKKLFLTLLFLFITIPCFAQDYYVYVRTYDRYHVEIENNKGRSKKGDIVEITRVKKDEFGNDRLPTEKEQQEWAIFRVNNLTDLDKWEYRKEWVENEGTDLETTKAYRRYKIEGVQFTAGYKGTITKANFKNKIKLKTEADIACYERGRKLYALTYPFRKFFRKFIEPFAYAAETISTINRTGEDYNTLTLWEDAKDGNITAGNAEVAECYNDDGDLDDKLTIAGWTTDSDSYIKVIAPTSASVGGTNERHSGTAASGFTLAPSTAGNAFKVGDGEFVYCIGLVIKANCGSTGLISGVRIDVGGFNVWLGYNVIYDAVAGTGDTPVGIKVVNVNGTLYAYNNIVYGFNDTNGTSGIGISLNGVTGGTSTAYLYNNTVTNNDLTGIRDNTTNTTITIKNNLCNGNGGDYFGTFDTTNGFNVSEDTTSPDVAYRSFAATFDNEAGDDFTVDDSPNDTTLDDGEDLSADGNLAFSDDIESVTRSPWYIGASEGPVAGAASPFLPSIIRWR